MYRDLIYRKESMKNSAAIVTWTVVSMVMTTIYQLAFQEIEYAFSSGNLLTLFLYNFTPKILLLVYVTGCYGNPKATWLAPTMYGIMLLNFVVSGISFAQNILPHMEYYAHDTEYFLRLLLQLLYILGMLITLTLAVFGSLGGMRSKGMTTTPGVLMIVYFGSGIAMSFLKYIVDIVDYGIVGSRFSRILENWFAVFFASGAALIWGIALVLFSRNKIPGVFPGAVRQDVEDAIAELDNRYTNGHMDAEVYDRRLEELAAKLR